MAKEIAARQEAELDKSKLNEQERLRVACEESESARRIDNPIVLGEGYKVHYPSNAAG